MISRSRSIQCLALALYLLSSLVVSLSGRAIIGSHLYLLGTTGMFIGMLVLWKSWPENGSMCPVVLVSILVRVAFVIGFPAGDDVNRYVWEGRIQGFGFNPFTQPPDAPELSHLRDPVWAGINHKSIPTIYWPLAQIMFRIVAFISPTLIAFKVAFTLFDLGILALVIKITRNRRLDPRHSFLYALNPLVIVFTSGEGHLEAMVVFWMALSLYGYFVSRFGLMSLAIGLAIMTKPSMMLLAPLAFYRPRLRAHLWLLLPFLLVLPYVESVRSIFDVPYLFATRFTHNGLLYLFSRRILNLPHQAALILGAVTFCAVFLYAFFLVPSYLQSSRMSVAAFLLCSPTVHPWYFILMSPFICLFRSAAWLSLQWSALALIFYFNPSAQDTVYYRNGMLIVVEYTLFLALVSYESLSGRTSWPARYDRSRTVSVIVPMLNEESNVAGCLDSIRRQSAASEIIVVDGGSKDRSRDVAASCEGVELLASEPGRGNQIAAGVAKASGDVVLIVHADTRLREGAVGRMMNALEENPGAAGGAFGADYDRRSRWLGLVRLMNDMRARFTGVSFGDQAQFYRKRVLKEGFPRMCLMEDVELSLRLKERGALLFLPHGVESSSRRWMERGFRRNSARVLSLVLRYLVARRFRKHPDRGEFYYLKYYGRPSRDDMIP